jgi:hypothetical protein
MDTEQKYLAVLTRCKDEFFIKEWVDYYLSQDVDLIYIIDDNSKDRTIYNFLNEGSKYSKVNVDYQDDMYKNINTEKNGDLDKNSYPNQVYNNKIKNKYKWLLYCDVDEFIVTKKNNKLTIVQQLQNISNNDINLIAVPWVLMSGGNLKENPKSILKQIKYRHNHDKKHPHSVRKFRCRYDEIECKSIFKTQHFEYIKDHHPIGYDKIHNGINLKNERMNEKDFFLKNFRNKDIKNGVFLCYHYRYISEENTINKLKTNNWYINDEYTKQDLISSTYPEIHDETLEKKVNNYSANDQNEYETIVCIYSSCKHIKLARKLKKNLKMPNTKILIFVSNGCRIKHYSPDIIQLGIDEGYNLLSWKTYNMLKYLNQNYKFKKMYKIDATVETGETCQQHEESKQEIKKKFFKNRKDFNTIQYFGASERKTPKEYIPIWAEKKGINVNIDEWDNIIPYNEVEYYSGKFYGIGSDFFYYIMNHSNIEELAFKLKTHLGGSEDLMIGLLYKLYLIYKKQ